MKGAFVTDPDQDPGELTPQGLRDALVIHGSPVTVAEKLLDLRERVGPFGTLVATAHDWTEPDALRRSMQLLAREVMPAVDAATGART